MLGSSTAYFLQKKMKKSALAKGISIMSTGRKYEEAGFARKLLSCLQGSHEFRSVMRRRARQSGVGANSVSRLDKISRVLFPLAFTALNVMYWAVYYFKVA